MPMSPTPTTLLAPRTGVLKLRSSCDGCGTAKVKCDRGQPGCGRCVTLGQPCVYRQSRRFGKPPRKRLGADLETSLSQRKHIAWSVQSRDATDSVEQPKSVNEPVELTKILPLPSGIDNTLSDTSRNTNTTMSFGQPGGVSEPAQLNFTGPVADAPLCINTTLSMYEQNQLGSPFFTSMFLDEWPQFDGSGDGLEIPSILKGSPPERRLSASVLEPASTRPNSHETHSCPRGSYEILRDLICPSPSLHAPEENSDTVSAQLDEILHVNRNAIDRLSRLLKCPCAKSGHRVMVNASIVSRILIWYQQAAGWTESSSLGFRSSALAASPISSSVSSSSPPPEDTDTTNPRTLSQSTGFAVSHVPVFMGTFTIEDQNVQAVFRNQLVLSELKKAANLIELFTAEDSGGSSANGVASLYSHLGTWLRSEHSRTVRILRSRLKALNENLDS